MSEDYVLTEIRRDGYVGKIMYDSDAEMPDFDGDGHILLVHTRFDNFRVTVENVDCGRDVEASALADALYEAIRRWSLDWYKIERYLRAFHDVTSLDYTDWDGDTLVALATRELATEGWGNPNGVVNLAPYKAVRDGEVYGYIVEDETTGEHIDSCWGYYGDDSLADVRYQIKSAIDYEVEKKHEAAIEFYRRMVNRS